MVIIGVVVVVVGVVAAVVVLVVVNNTAGMIGVGVWVGADFDVWVIDR